MKFSWRRCLFLALALVVGCQGQINDPENERPGDPDEPPPLDCSDLQPGRAPMRRLTVDEYDNTVRDLLGDTTGPATRLIDDERGVTSADARLVTVLLVEQYLTAAEDVAARAVGDLPTLLDCDRATVGDDECARQFIDRVGSRAYRRPITDEEATVFFDLYALVASEMTFAEGIQSVVEAILQAPAFLYRPEIVPLDGEAVVRLDGYQVATRLSYFLWSTMPDAFLLEAAANGELEDEAAIAAHARRMLEDPRSEGAIQRFFDHFLELDQLDGLSKDPEVFPDFEPAIAELMRQETEAFIHAVLIDPEGDRSWATLMTADWSMMNAELAAYYGVDGPTVDSFERVALDPEHHAGLLTHGSFLATRARSYESSPVHRGMFVRGTLLCGIVPDVPENLEVDPPDPDPSLTTRERLAEHREDPACGSCHRQLDPLGFAFEHFDGDGRFRPTENGLPIDASGLMVDSDVDGEFDGPVELAAKLTESEQAQACFASTLFESAQGRASNHADGCSIAQLMTDFQGSDFDVRELMVAITQTDAFLYRVADQDTFLPEEERP